MIHRQAADLFGRHVAHRAEHGAGVGDRGLRAGAGYFRVRGVQHRLRQTEVEDLYPALVGDEQVVGLDVAVGDVARVGRGQAVGGLAGVVHGLAHRQRPGVEALAQGAPLQQLEHDVAVFLGAAEVVDGQDVGVRQRGHGLRLALEACEGRGIVGHLRRQDLQSDVPVEARIAGPVDLAHAARAHERHDLVAVEAFTGGKRHAGILCQRCAAPVSADRVFSRRGTPRSATSSAPVEREPPRRTRRRPPAR